ncbi:hypothetical protein, partial [Actinocorallia lasiicapitis]
ELGLRAALSAIGRLIVEPSPDGFRRAAEILDEAERAGADPTRARLIRGGLEGARILNSGDEGAAAHAIEMMLETSEELRDQPRLRDLSLGLAVPLLVQRYHRSGRRDDLEAAVRLAEQVAGGADGAGELTEEQYLLKYFLSVAKLSVSAERELPGTFEEAVAALKALKEPQGTFLQDLGFGSDLPVIELLARGAGPDGFDLKQAREAGIEGFEDFAHQRLAEARAAAPDTALYTANLGQAGELLVHQGFVTARIGLVEQGLAALA